VVDVEENDGTAEEEEPGEKPDAKIAALAEKQHGCLTRSQAHDLGVTDGMLQHRLAAGRWQRCHPGVYRVAGVTGSWLADVWAAVLAVGDRTVVSRESALLVHGVVSDAQVARRPIRLTVPHGRHHRIRGARIHQIDDMRPHHRTTIDGLAVSLIERAVVDMAATIGERELGGLVDDLIVSRATRLTNIGSCFAEVARAGKPGVRRLARVLDDRGPGHVPPHSELERRLFHALEAAGLPAPKRQIPLPSRSAIAGIADAGYADVRMLLEADGRRWHTRVRDLRRDHERDAEAARAGWVTLRFMHEQLVSTPAEVAATVADVRLVRLAQLAGGAA
jgi:very-short-patch-repair endonuclease